MRSRSKRSKRKIRLKNLLKKAGFVIWSAKPGTTSWNVFPKGASDGDSNLGCVTFIGPHWELRARTGNLMAESTDEAFIIEQLQMLQLILPKHSEHGVLLATTRLSPTMVDPAQWFTWPKDVPYPWVGVDYAQKTAQEIYDLMETTQCDNTPAGSIS